MSKRKSEEIDNQTIKNIKLHQQENETLLYNTASSIKNATLYQCAEAVLVKLFSMKWMTEAYKMDESEMKPSGKPKAKAYRAKFPDEEIQTKMRDVAQNSDEWHGHRSESAGGSGLGALMGWDLAGFVDNVQLWFVEAGRYIKAASKSVLDSYFMKHGHYWEDEAGMIYACLMGTTFYIVGLLLHWMVAFMHISPDGLSQYLPNRFHNIYSKYDSLRGNAEIKNPIFHAYETKNGIHNVPTHYLIQTMMQMHTFLTDWCDFIVHWRANEKCKPISMEKTKGAGVWLVGETLITRIYRNNQFCEKVIQYQRQFMNHLKKQDVILNYVDDANYIYSIPPPKPTEQVWIYYRLNQSAEPIDNIQISPNDFILDEKSGKLQILYDKNNEFNDLRFSGGPEGTTNQKWAHATHYELLIMYPPKRIVEVPMPEVQILPLKKVYWYLYTNPDKSPYNAETNSLEGMLKPEIHHYWDQKPYLVSMHDLKSKTEDLKEVDIFGETKQCPNCKTECKRNEDTFNHIQCVSCGNSWCWLCNEANIAIDHYQVSNSRCFQKSHHNENTKAALPADYQIQNPMWKKKMAEEPEKNISQIIWEWSTAKQNILNWESLI